MKPLKSKNPDKHLLNTISYFSFFGYPPSLDEIHTFFPKKITKNDLKKILESMIKQKRLISSTFIPHLPSSQVPPWAEGDPFGLKEIPPRVLRVGGFGRNDNLGYFNNPNPPPFQISNFKFQINLYTLPQYTAHFKNRATRQVIYQKKLVLMNYYIETLAKIPFIRFIGITGSASMGNTTSNDDVDLFIITSRNCMFIGRFFAILFAHILHVRKGKNSVCLNLFFDESDLVIPLQKQTPYVAHEVLQMKPVVNKGQVYERFLKANEWAYDIFPNALLFKNRHPERLPWKGSRGIPLFKRFLHASSESEDLVGMTTLLIFPFEFLFKQIQLAIIRRNKTGLIISPTQLWLFKKDFEKKMINQTSRYI